MKDSNIHGHRTLKAPHPVRSAKLTRVPPSQYHGGGPRGNPRCCGFNLSFLIFLTFHLSRFRAGFRQPWERDHLYTNYEDASCFTFILICTVQQLILLSTMYLLASLVTLLVTTSPGNKSLLCSLHISCDSYWSHLLSFYFLPQHNLLYHLQFNHFTLLVTTSTGNHHFVISVLVITTLGSIYFHFIFHFRTLCFTTNSLLTSP